MSVNRHVGKVFWISLIFSSANIENFAEAIPIGLKVPFLLHGKSFNILPSWRGTSLVFQINMCICLFIWKIQLRLTWKNIPPTSIFQVQKLRYFPINTFISNCAFIWKTSLMQYYYMVHSQCIAMGRMSWEDQGI